MSFTVRLPLSVSGFLQFQTQKLGTLTIRFFDRIASNRYAWSPLSVYSAVESARRGRHSSGHKQGKEIQKFHKTNQRLLYLLDPEEEEDDSDRHSD
ncbi:hypothetical protein YC2023_013128 [Brassica napus]